MTKETHQIYASGGIVEVDVLFDRYDFHATFLSPDGGCFGLRGTIGNTPSGHDEWHTAYQRARAALRGGKDCGWYIAAS